MRRLIKPMSNLLESSLKSIKSSSSLKSIKSSEKSEKSLSLSSASRSRNHSNAKMKVIPIRALQDNYMYLLVDCATRHAAAIDPVNAGAISAAVHEQNLDLKAVLTTHHHYDHANGNADMLTMFPDLAIYGGDSRVQAINRTIGHKDIITLGAITIECLSTPCHTKGHICYYATYEDQSEAILQQANTTEPAQERNNTTSNIERAVFTGDTLFIAGCGRFFEGNSEQMDQNLNYTLGNLPSDTKVYCGHEYTVANLKFALAVEPQNVDIKNKLAWAQNKVAHKEPTVPSTIGDEKKINPFMRLKRPQVRKFTEETEDVEVMTVLRHKKNEFQA